MHFVWIKKNKNKRTLDTGLESKTFCSETKYCHNDINSPSAITTLSHCLQAVLRATESAGWTDRWKDFIIRSYKNRTVQQQDTKSNTNKKRPRYPNQHCVSSALRLLHHTETPGAHGYVTIWGDGQNGEGGDGEESLCVRTGEGWGLNISLPPSMSMQATSVIQGILSKLLWSGSKVGDTDITAAYRVTWRRQQKENLNYELPEDRRSRLRV